MSHYFTEYIIDNVTADEATASAAFQIPQWAVFCGVWIVNVDAADIGLSICETTGGTYQPVLDPADGADLVICASASYRQPGFVSSPTVLHRTAVPTQTSFSLGGNSETTKEAA
jgi:hypothetical protein